MHLLRLAHGLLPAVAILASASGAVAQSPLADAERSYVAVDFDATLRHATRALEEGGHPPNELARIYELIGVAKETLRDYDGAKAAFLRLLALRPDARTHEVLAPTARGSFLEARGFWAAQQERLGVRVDISSETGALRISLSDPIQMARRVVIRARAPNARAFVQTERPAARNMSWNAPGLEGQTWASYILRVLDEHGNTLLEIGSEESPETVGQRRGRGEEEEESGSIFASPWFWIVTGVVVAGAVSAILYWQLVVEQEDAPVQEVLVGRVRLGW